MEHLTQWLPTITTACVVVGVAFVADSSIKRHEKVLEGLVGKVQELEKDMVAVRTTLGLPEKKKG